MGKEHGRGPRCMCVRVCGNHRSSLHQHGNNQFKTHFRMHRHVFQLLCEWVVPHLTQVRSISTEKKVLATLWLLGNKESYRGVADRFGMNKGSLHRIVRLVCQAFTELRGDVIQWPEKRTLSVLADQWSDRAGFPGVVGAIDGTYIKILGANGLHRDAYICRKGFPAMHLQVVCDKDLRFIDVQTGNAGSVHDSRVFTTSPLAEVLNNEDTRLPPDYHLLGDSAYGLKTYMMVPFRDNGHLSELERRYNSAHARTRVEVERSIGLLKGKFRRLKDLEMTALLDIPRVIFAACILHNFIIRESGVDTDDIELPDDDEEEEAEIHGGARVSGVDKRMAIAQRL